MFVAMDNENKKHYAFNESKEVLKIYSNNNELFCPHCMKRAIFHAGDRKIYHFKNTKGAECTYKGEPESEDQLTNEKRF